MPDGSDRRAQARTALSLFAALGAQVGAFAVLVPDLAASRGLTPAALGAGLAVMAAASIATLFTAGPLADRHGRRPLLLAGVGGFAAAFALLASLVAATAGHRIAYTAMAGGYALLAAAAARAPLPGHVEPAPEAVAGPVAAGRLALLRVPGIAIATAICTLCFFGDGAIEGFSALLLRGTQGAGTLGAGLSLAAFHAASLAGRLWFARMGDARGDAIVLTAAGVLAAAAMAVLVTAGSPVLGGGALLVVGFALAPVIPTVLSLAGRSAPGRSGAAVSLVTTVGYSAFVLGPPIVGILAGLTSLRAALALAIVTMLAFAVLGRRLAGAGTTSTAH